MLTACCRSGWVTVRHPIRNHLQTAWKRLLYMPFLLPNQHCLVSLITSLPVLIKIYTGMAVIPWWTCERWWGADESYGGDNLSPTARRSSTCQYNLATPLACTDTVDNDNRILVQILTHIHTYIRQESPSLRHQASKLVSTQVTKKQQTNYTGNPVLHGVVNEKERERRYRGAGWGLRRRYPLPSWEGSGEGAVPPPQKTFWFFVWQWCIMVHSGRLF